MENYTTHDNSVTEGYNSSRGNKAATTAGDGCQTTPSFGTVNVQTAAAKRSHSTVGDCRRLGRTRPTTTTITAEPRQWSYLDFNRSHRTPAEPNVVSGSNQTLRTLAEQPIKCTNSDHLYAYTLTRYSERSTNVTTLENQHKPKNQNIGKRQIS